MCETLTNEVVKELLEKVMEGGFFFFFQTSLQIFISTIHISYI